MRPHVMLAVAGWLLVLTPLMASAQDAPPATVEALQARIAELERENRTLRMQWGQTTMELDRLRKEHEELRQQLAKRQAPAAPAAGSTDPATPPATTAASDVEAELARLRRENADLRSEKAELTELAGITADGENVAAQDARITREFDADANQTIVRTRPQAVRMLAGSAADHYLSLVYVYPGRELTDTAAAKVTGYLQALHSGGVYAGDDVIKFTLDGETLVVPITDRRVDQRQTSMAGRRRIDKSDEMLVFALDPDALRRLARTVQGEARIGNVRFELSRDDVAMFKAVQRRIEKGL